MAYPWESELPALAALSDQAAADAINAITVPAPAVMVFGSFRTLAAILTQTEYNVLKSALASVASQEASAGGSYINDMIAMLKLPGDANGNGGGLNFGDPAFVANVQAICAAANLTDVPGKIAAYVATYQLPPLHKYQDVATAPLVNWARSQL